RVRGWSRRARIASDAIVAAQCGQLVAEGLGVSEGETRDADGAPHPAGGVDDDAGEAESSLEGTLARVDVLDARVRDDARGAPEHAALYDEVVVADGEAPGTVARPRQERSGRAADSEHGEGGEGGARGTGEQPAARGADAGRDPGPRGEAEAPVRDHASIERTDVGVEERQSAVTLRRWLGRRCFDLRV